MNAECRIMNDELTLDTSKFFVHHSSFDIHFFSFLGTGS